MFSTAKIAETFDFNGSLGRSHIAVLSVCVLLHFTFSEASNCDESIHTTQ